MPRSTVSNLHATKVYPSWYPRPFSFHPRTQFPDSYSPCSLCHIGPYMIRSKEDNATFGSQNSASRFQPLTLLPLHANNESDLPINRIVSDLALSSRRACRQADLSVDVKRSRRTTRRPDSGCQVYIVNSFVVAVNGALECS